MTKNKKPAISFMVELTGFAGMLMLAYGLWLIRPEAMFTVIGLIFITMSVLLHRGFNKTNPSNHGG